MTRAVAVLGPTAVGKTELSLRLAEALGAEILGCDSMQIYRYMDIGTAKPTAAERAAVPHHMVDFLTPDLPYSAADYARDAAAAVKKVREAGKLPLFCGGTGLYLEAVRSARHGQGLAPNEAVRRALEAEAEARGGTAMYEDLRRIDPAAAAATHQNNLRRVLRALEIYRVTGRTKSDWDAETKRTPPALSLLTLGLMPPDREALHRRIDRRVDAMMEAGFYEEVGGLLARGYLRPDSTAGQAIGYRELAAVHRGEMTREAAIAEIKFATHRYARRQLTWFRAIPGIVWLPVSEDGATGELYDRALRLTADFLCGEPSFKNVENNL